MSDIRLTNEKMNTFDSSEKIGTFKAAEKLSEFGEKQNEANIALAANVNDLIKRVCELEENDLKVKEAICKVADDHAEAMQKISAELKAVKADLDRLRLSTKLNTSTIERLNNAIHLAEGDGTK